MIESNLERKGNSMAAKKATVTRKKATRRKTATRKKAAAKGALTRVQVELPATLQEFADLVRSRLGKLERAVEKAEVRYRREAARVLRQASHQLGRFEAEGERRWKKLTTQARREALAVLRRMEKALAAGR
jgi:hypothetical protein